MSKTTEKLVSIEAKLREGTGKSYTRKLRKAGWLPANLQASGKATSIELNPRQLDKAFANNRTFNLNLDGKETLVKVSEVQIHPVKRVPIHLDLVPVK